MLCASAARGSAGGRGPHCSTHAKRSLPKNEVNESEAATRLEPEDEREAEVRPLAQRRPAQRHHGRQRQRPRNRQQQRRSAGRGLRRPAGSKALGLKSGQQAAAAALAVALAAGLQGEEKRARCSSSVAQLIPAQHSPNYRYIVVPSPGLRRRRAPMASSRSGQPAAAHPAAAVPGEHAAQQQADQQAFRQAHRHCTCAARCACSCGRPR